MSARPSRAEEERRNVIVSGGPSCLTPVPTAALGERVGELEARGGSA